RWLGSKALTCHFSGGVCSTPNSLFFFSFSCLARSFIGHLVVGEEGHIPQFLTGSPSANLSFSRGCVQRDSLSLSFWRLTRWLRSRGRATHTPRLLLSSPSPHTPPGSDKFRLAVHLTYLTGSPSLSPAES